MKKNLKQGFTLIELLVVIAIIGILASVVLVNLNSAREKGKDASAISSMSSLRAQVELEADGGDYSAACTDGATLITAAQNQTGTTADCADIAGSWGASIELTTGSFYCVDSTGYAGTLSTDPAIDDTNTTCL